MLFVSGNIVIEIPKGSILEYDIKSISGDISHDAISKDRLTVSSITGAIAIRQGGEKVFIESIIGPVKIYSPFEELSTESIIGNVHIVANQDSKQVSSTNIIGSAKIQLVNVLGYEIDYSTVLGSIEDSYENINYSKSGSAIKGDSSLKIKVSSVIGSIKLVGWNN